MAQKSLVNDILKAIFGNHAYWIINNSRIVLIGCSLAVAGAVSLYYFYQSRSSMQVQAFGALHDSLEELSKVPDDRAALKEASAAALAGQQQFAASNAAPYFDLIAAQVALRDGDMQQAQTLVAQAYSKLSKDNPLYSLVTTMYARILLDSEATLDQQKGEKLLRQLADDASNKQQDVAQYYLAHWYQDHGNVAQAQPLFEKLAQLKSQEKDDKKQSPWAIAA